MKTSAEKLKMLRELKGMSQADCAKALGLDRTTYVKYENGGSVRRNVEKLARFFNVSIDYLLGYTDDPLPAPPAPQKSAAPPELNARDERDIQKRLESMLDDLDPNAGLAYYNGQEPMDDETRDLIRAALENSLRVAKQIAKAKYTPKKYRK